MGLTLGLFILTLLKIDIKMNVRIFLKIDWKD